jgi:hypothetical protein
MKLLWCSFAALALSLVLVAGSVRAERDAAQDVVVPRDEKPFKVSRTDLVRLTGRGIAGAQITANIDGPARVATTYRIQVRSNGMPLIGSNVTEFEIKPTGTGKVTVTIVVKPPQPDAQPKQTVYTFEVE